MNGHSATANTPGAQPLLSRLLAGGGRSDVQRAIAELLAGRPVLLTDTGHDERLAFPVDGLTPAMLAELRSLVASEPANGLQLVVSGTRAASLGCPGVASGALPVPESVDHAQLIALVSASAVAQGDLHAVPVQGDRVGEAAVELAKLAHLLPAMLTIAARTLTQQGHLAGQVLRVAAADVLAFRAGHAPSLRRVSSARVPLRGAAHCELVAFRDDLGEVWSLIRIGEPDLSATVPVRLHSACLTGDVFASLRCDCGDQLAMAIASIEALGGGILLYLNQEGCGIGLANKMRAYRLQDQGLDTIDANTTLGFERDERRYDTAARMLAMMGVQRVALLTNNPSKVGGLQQAGIEVIERLPLLAPVRSDNRGYLETKRRRAGHLFGEAALLPQADG
jgi:GTP cyclohydrolase II